MSFRKLDEFDQMRLCGFDPDDPAQVEWFRNLPMHERQRLHEMLNDGKMTTFTDMFIGANKVADDGDRFFKMRNRPPRRRTYTKYE